MILINKNLQTFWEKIVHFYAELCARKDAGFFGKENDKIQWENWDKEHGAGFYKMPRTQMKL